MPYKKPWLTKSEPRQGFFGGDGGIRTPGTGEGPTDFESASLRPLRYISVFSFFIFSKPNVGTLESKLESGKPTIRSAVSRSALKSQDCHRAAFQSANRISSQPRYDHFDTSPCAFLTIPFRPPLVNQSRSCIFLYRGARRAHRGQKVNPAPATASRPPVFYAKAVFIFAEACYTD